MSLRARSPTVSDIQLIFNDNGYGLLVSISVLGRNIGPADSYTEFGTFMGLGNDGRHGIHTSRTI
jgi:hypothetical protein